MIKRISRILLKGIYYLLWVLPLRNRVVASAYGGHQYADNPRFITEQIHQDDPSVEIIWVMRKDARVETPGYVKTVSGIFSVMIAYATAGVWIETHHIPLYVTRRKSQMMIETWHGGLGIKRIGNDAVYYERKRGVNPHVAHTVASASVFLSNCDHLTSIYREGFGYKGKVWKCGFPKNDALLLPPDNARAAVRASYGLPQESRILVYAPTFRQYKTDGNTYGVKMDELRAVLQKCWGGEWTLIVRWHPILASNFTSPAEMYGNAVLDGSFYPNMQELIQGCDVFLTDYSSAVFDAAQCGVPCFLYTPDFEKYKDERGVYYELDELPFPHGDDNAELCKCVENYDKEKAKRDWQAFIQRTGLYESGHAARDVAALAEAWLKGDHTALDRIPDETI